MIPTPIPGGGFHDFVNFDSKSTSEYLDVPKQETQGLNLDLTKEAIAITAYK